MCTPFRHAALMRDFVLEIGAQWHLSEEVLPTNLVKHMRGPVCEPRSGHLFSDVSFRKPPRMWLVNTGLRCFSNVRA